MKTFFLALSFAMEMRKYVYYDKYSFGQYRKWFQLMWEVHKDSLQQPMSQLSDLKRTKDLDQYKRWYEMYLDLYYKEQEKLEEYKKQVYKAHEEEIIRLKDIIQAKQVQIDKLLEGKNEV